MDFPGRPRANRGMDLERHRRVATSRLAAETRDDMGPGAVAFLSRKSRRGVAAGVKGGGTPWKIMKKPRKNMENPAKIMKNPRKTMVIPGDFIGISLGDSL